MWPTILEQLWSGLYRIDMILDHVIPILERELPGGSYMNVSNGCHSAKTIGKFSIAHGFAMASHQWFQHEKG